MPDDLESNLAIEEYKSCRSLIEKNIDIMEKNEVFVVGAAGALFVFSISATTRSVAIASAWAPFIISFVGWLRFRGLDKTIDITNEYIMQLELLHGIGYVSHYKRMNKEQGKSLKLSRQIFWLVLKIVCICFAVYMMINAPLTTAPAHSS